MEEGGCFARIFPVDATQNRRHGGYWSNFVRHLAFGEQFAYVLPAECWTAASMECCRDTDKRLISNKWFDPARCPARSWGRKKVILRPSYALGRRQAYWQDCVTKYEFLGGPYCTVHYGPSKPR